MFPAFDTAGMEAYSINWRVNTVRNPGLTYWIDNQLHHGCRSQKDILCVLKMLHSAGLWNLSRPVLKKILLWSWSLGCRCLNCQALSERTQWSYACTKQNSVITVWKCSKISYNNEALTTKKKRSAVSSHRLHTLNHFPVSSPLCINHLLLQTALRRRIVWLLCFHAGCCQYILFSGWHRPLGLWALK